MAKILVFQHVAAEPLGVLLPLIREHGHRIRYINFGRNPEQRTDLNKYDALIVLGGPMMPDQESDYPHLRWEKQTIATALKRNLPVLGICLGAQLLAHTLGAPVRPNQAWEIGWYDVTPTPQAADDPVFSHFRSTEKVFQWHGYTFDLPQSAELLASSAGCAHQAFVYGQAAYGLQFHLELDEALIGRWLGTPAYLTELQQSGLATNAGLIRAETQQHIQRSIELSRIVFGQFLNLVGQAKTTMTLSSR